MDVDIVMISKAEYEQLLCDAMKLSVLEEMGVDNWSGYGEAMHLLEHRMHGDH